MKSMATCAVSLLACMRPRISYVAPCWQRRRRCVYQTVLQSSGSFDMVKAFVGDRAVVVAVPVPTPAGGLVRVIGSTGEQLLDSSYPAGTAACSLLEKMKWKLGDPDTRGPPPFKKPPAVAWPEKLAAVLTSLEAEGFSPPGEGVPSFEEAVAVREAELAALEKPVLVLC